jgi:NAD(P)-dependent dehydrogenase (short-subunit alcohol dehydrogenase family)
LPILTNSEIEPAAPPLPRLALITGAAGGIGRACAIQLAHRGYSLVLLDIDQDGLGATAAELPQSADPVLLLECDLQDPERIAASLARAQEQRGAPQLLVNVAGVGISATIVETKVSDWDRLVSINLSAIFHTCRLTIPRMLAVGGGVIVNVSSVGGLVGLSQRAAYCATKAGVIGLTRAIAADHARQGIRANAICPGTVATEWIGRILEGTPDPEAARRAMEARQLDGRLGSPQEVAAGVAFLASDDARFVNGSAFVMDGGMTAV